MNEIKIQEVIRKSREAGVSRFQVSLLLTRYPYLLTPLEAEGALERSESPELVKAAQTGRLNTRVNVQSNYTPSKINRAAVKAFALEVSDKKKAGKFERVSSEHLKWVEAELENIIQGICRNSHSDDDLASSGWDFLNWKQVAPRVKEKLNLALRRAIFSRVKNQPSPGKTIK